jgi:low temperature requirement protein LtrA
MRGLVLPEPTEDFTADPVELFFDLAFVLAFSQIVSHLVHHPTWKAAAESALVFLILWLAWSTFTWAANAVQGSTREVRAIFLVATAASIPMGASITTAYDSGGGTFAVCASIIILMAIGLQLWGLDPSSEQFRSVLKYAIPNIVAMATLVIGGFVGGTPQVVLWIASIAITLLAMARAGDSEWLVRSGHFAERHGLIVIIALGEVVVAIGISVIDSLGEGEGLPNRTLWGLIAAGVLAGLLWWAYFDRVMPALEHRNESLHGPDAGRFSRDVYTGLHLPIVGGIITAAAAVEEILLHPKDPVHTEFLIMLVAGLALFFLGIAGAVFRAFRAIAKERIAGVAAIAALAWIGRSWDGVALLLVVDVVILLSLIVEHLRVEGPNQTASTAETASTV